MDEEFSPSMTNSYFSITANSVTLEMKRRIKIETLDSYLTLHGHGHALSSVLDKLCCNVFQNTPKGI